MLINGNGEDKRVSIRMRTLMTKVDWNAFQYQHQVMNLLINNINILRGFYRTEISIMSGCQNIRFPINNIYILNEKQLTNPWELTLWDFYENVSIS